MQALLINCYGTIICWGTRTHVVRCARKLNSQGTGKYIVLGTVGTYTNGLAMAR